MVCALIFPVATPADQSRIPRVSAQAAWDPGEVAAPRLLLRACEAAVVGADGLNLAGFHRLPERFGVCFLSDRRRADEARCGIIVRRGIDAVVQQQILRAGLDEHADALRTSGAHCVEALLRGEMHDHGKRVRLSRHLAEAFDRRRLRGGRTAQRMRDRGEKTRLLQGGGLFVNLAADFTVHTCESAVLCDLPHRGDLLLLGKLHGGVGHVHFEGAHALPEHFGDFRADAVIPVVHGPPVLSDVFFHEMLIRFPRTDPLFPERPDPQFFPAGEPMKRETTASADPSLYCNQQETSMKEEEK